MINPAAVVFTVLIDWHIRLSVPYVVCLYLSMMNPIPHTASHIMSFICITSFPFIRHVSVSQDKRLRRAVEKFGTRWQEVAEFVGDGVNPAQVSHRWRHYLDPNKSMPKGAWTEEEVCRIIVVLLYINLICGWLPLCSLVANLLRYIHTHDT